MKANELTEMAVLDTETTGIDVFNDRIVTAFLGLMTPTGEWTEKKSWIINPGIEISQGAIDVHGITNERAVAEGVDAADGIFSILQAIDIYDRKGIPVAAYNAAFDFTILKSEAERYGWPFRAPRFILDGYVIDKKLDPYRKGKRQLGVTAKHYGFEMTNAHDAEADCEAAGRVTYRLLKHKWLFDKELSYIHDKTVEHAKEQAAGLQAYFRKTDPSAIVDGTWPIRSRSEGAG